MKQTYKMVVTDFDGTLLRSDNTISDYTRKVIAAFRSRGGIFTVSTGRMHRSIVQRIAETGIDGSIPLMSYQGALVRESLSGKTLFSQPLNADAVKQAVAFCEQTKQTCQIYDFDDVFVPQVTPLSAAYCQINRVTPVVVGSLSQYLRNHSREWAKILLYVQPEERYDVCARLTEWVGDTAQVFVSAPNLVEMVSPLAGKHNGVRFAAEQFNISMDEVIAVGDEMNDAGMVAAAGLGVAVANAVDGVKAVAKAMTDSNDADGVAKLIEKYCL